jgi:hypothetical protein
MLGAFSSAALNFSCPFSKSCRPFSSPSPLTLSFHFLEFLSAVLFSFASNSLLSIPRIPVGRSLLLHPQLSLGATNIEAALKFICDNTVGLSKKSKNITVWFLTDGEETFYDEASTVFCFLVSSREIPSPGVFFL